MANRYTGRHECSVALQWRHDGRDSVSNHQPHDCLLNRLFRRRSKKTSKLRVPGLCVVNSPGTGEFPAQMAGYAENVSIWWRHHGLSAQYQCIHIIMCVTPFIHFTGSWSSISGKNFVWRRDHSMSWRCPRKRRHVCVSIPLLRWLI